MSTQVNQADPAQQSLSEKARRLLAAHDREVSQMTREIVREPSGQTYRMAG
ncbi:hypothetical protein [Roseovarius sp. 2305UL8-3]|uniref:hypothetical protein n=1 Tax=Roseovarius conchicola TaxID=3121636 RepID=UPI00352824A1